ncbi:hypothetical protein Hanom_Chr16g01487491 [Helianthus anomalus]
MFRISSQFLSLSLRLNSLMDCRRCRIYGGALLTAVDGRLLSSSMWFLVSRASLVLGLSVLLHLLTIEQL